MQSAENSNKHRRSGRLKGARPKVDFSEELRVGVGEGEAGGESPPTKKEEEEEDGEEYATAEEEEEEVVEKPRPVKRGRLKKRPSSRASSSSSDHMDVEDDTKMEIVEIEEEEEEEERPQKEGDISEIFTTYRPKKLTIGKPHPGRIVETSVLARAVPPDITYQLHPGR